MLVRVTTLGTSKRANSDESSALLNATCEVERETEDDLGVIYRANARQQQMYLGSHIGTISSVKIRRATSTTFVFVIQAPASTAVANLYDMLQRDVTMDVTPAQAELAPSSNADADLQLPANNEEATEAIPA
jgi:hypothetical protein